MQWYWPFVAGVVAAQLTETGVVSKFFEYVLPSTLYRSSYILLNVSKTLCWTFTKSFVNVFIPKRLPNNPPRTFHFNDSSPNLDENIAEDSSHHTLEDDTLDHTLEDTLKDTDSEDTVEDTTPEHNLAAEVVREIPVEDTTPEHNLAAEVVREIPEEHETLNQAPEELTEVLHLDTPQQEDSRVEQ
jgi:hypothetical protein